MALRATTAGSNLVTVTGSVRSASRTVTTADPSTTPHVISPPRTATRSMSWPSAVNRSSAVSGPAAVTRANKASSRPRATVTACACSRPAKRFSADATAW